MFFFVNYDGQRRNFPATVNFHDPARASTGAVHGAGMRRDARVLHGLKASSIRARATTTSARQGRLQSEPERNNLTVQYNMHRWDSPNGVQTAPVISVAPSANGTDIVKTDFVVASLNTVLSPSVAQRGARADRPRLRAAAAERARPEHDGDQRHRASACRTSCRAPKYPDERRYEFIDNISHYVGAHSLKAGVDINYVQENLINLFQGGGRLRVSATSTRSRRTARSWRTGCTPLVTGRRHRRPPLHQLHAGVRPARRDLPGRRLLPHHRLQRVRPGHLEGHQPADAESRPALRVPEAAAARRRLGQRHSVENGNPAYPATMTFHQDKNNFGPRLGFTYDLNGAHQTVVRGGWGIYYGRTSNSAISSALTNNAVTLATYTFNPTTAGAPAYPNILTGAADDRRHQAVDQLPVADAAASADLRGRADARPRASATTSPSARSYLYSRGTHLPLFYDTNLPAGERAGQRTRSTAQASARSRSTAARGPTPTSTPPSSSSTSSKSSYHAMVLQLNKRYTHGLLFNAQLHAVEVEGLGPELDDVLRRASRTRSTRTIRSSTTARRISIGGIASSPARTYAPSYLCGRPGRRRSVPSRAACRSRRRSSITSGAAQRHRRW